MRCLVRFASAVVVIGALSVPVPASAGGANFLDFDEEFNAIDSEVTVRGTFYGDRSETRAHAPFYVFLERLDYEGQGWDLPKVGGRGVYRVAEADIVWNTDPEFLPGGSVSATFQVPDVRRGRYLVSICDWDCKHRLGDIETSGFFRVVGSPGEARARAEMASLRERFRRYRHSEYRDDVKANKAHQAELDTAKRGEEFAIADLNSARDTIWSLRSDVSAARSRIDDLASQRNLVLVALLLVIGIAAALASRRRRSDLQLEALLQDVGQRRDGDLFEFVRGSDGGLLDVAHLPEVDRSSDKDHVGVR